MALYKKNEGCAAAQPLSLTPAIGAGIVIDYIPVAFGVTTMTNNIIVGLGLLIKHDKFFEIDQLFQVDHHLFKFLQGLIHINPPLSLQPCR